MSADSEQLQLQASNAPESPPRRKKRRIVFPDEVAPVDDDAVAKEPVQPLSPLPPSIASAHASQSTLSRTVQAQAQDRAAAHSLPVTSVRALQPRLRVHKRKYQTRIESDDSDDSYQPNPCIQARTRKRLRRCTVAKSSRSLEHKPTLRLVPDMVGPRTDLPSPTPPTPASSGRARERAKRNKADATWVPVTARTQNHNFASSVRKAAQATMNVQGVAFQRKRFKSLELVPEDDLREQTEQRHAKRRVAKTTKAIDKPDTRAAFKIKSRSKQVSELFSHPAAQAHFASDPSPGKSDSDTLLTPTQPLCPSFRFARQGKDKATKGKELVLRTITVNTAADESASLTTASNMPPPPRPGRLDLMPAPPEWLPTQTDELMFWRTGGMFSLPPTPTLPVVARVDASTSPYDDPDHLFSPVLVDRPRFAPPKPILQLGRSKTFAHGGPPLKRRVTFSSPVARQTSSFKRAKTAITPSSSPFRVDPFASMNAGRRRRLGEVRPLPISRKQSVKPDGRRRSPSGRAVLTRSLSQMPLPLLPAAHATRNDIDRGNEQHSDKEHAVSTSSRFSTPAYARERVISVTSIPSPSMIVPAQASSHHGSLHDPSPAPDHTLAPVSLTATDRASEQTTSPSPPPAAQRPKATRTSSSEERYWGSDTSSFEAALVDAFAFAPRHALQSEHKQQQQEQVVRADTAVICDVEAIARGVLFDLSSSASARS